MYLNKIKLFLVISVCLIFFFLTYFDVKSQEVKIVSGTAIISDGDTIKINNEKIRLAGIDAPEIKQKCYSYLLEREFPCGMFSKDMLMTITSTSKVTCFYTEKDRYKRILGTCYMGDLNSVAVIKKVKEANINRLMVRLGQAVAYRKYSNEYITDEEYAKKNLNGIWKGKFEMPWDWRKKN